MLIKLVLPQAAQLGFHFVYEKKCCTSPRDLLKDTLLTRYKERKPITWRDLNPSTHVHEVGILPLATIVSKWLKFAFGTKNWAVNVTKSFCLKKLEIIFSRSMFLVSCVVFYFFHTVFLKNKGSMLSLFSSAVFIFSHVYLYFSLAIFTVSRAVFTFLLLSLFF